MGRIGAVIVILLCLVSCKESKENQSTLAVEETYTVFPSGPYSAGDSIHMQFEGQYHPQIRLLLKNAWGMTLIKSSGTTQLKFKLPKNFSQKSGVLEWQLLGNGNILARGTSTIQPAKEKMPIMETYLGPPSIFANEKDQSMLVALPQDLFGNPVSDSSRVLFKTQFKGQQSTTEGIIRHGIAFDYLNTRSEVGELFVATQHGEQVSKEMMVQVLPSIPVNFEIEAFREHEYADGNQLVKFTTSTIMDTNGNRVADGTQVYFNILTSEGMPLQTVGQTLDGVAKTTLLHPEVPSSWRVTAHIEGMASSNTLNMDFKAALINFETVITKETGKVLVGPLKSYMRQLVPDGISIALQVQDAHGHVIHKVFTTSYRGMGKFDLPTNINLSLYTINISAGGITKTVPWP